MAYAYHKIRIGDHVYDEHRLVAGVVNKPNVVVHHKDGDKRNNDPANLEVMTRSEHARHHGFGTRIGRGR